MTGKLLLPLLFLVAFSATAQDFITPYEKSEKVASATYAEAIDHYQRLSDAYSEIQVLTFGKTDVGKPLHLVVVSNQKIESIEDARNQGKRILLVNNGIHPGEPCGIDACMMLARDIAQDKEMKKMLDNVVLCIIPVYNIGGALNRGSFSRANQLGPKAYGFRGNARNFDLNRDFIKCDTRNARSFAEIFHHCKPDIFIDTHTTNGADYPAVLTTIPTLSDKAAKPVANYMDNQLMPAIYAHMEKKQIKICPYVYSTGQTPDGGIKAFIDHPRYSSGYASLFQTMAMITEAHMLKTFEERVTATYEVLVATLSHINAHSEAIATARSNAQKSVIGQQEVVLTWGLDTDRVDSLQFDGFEAKYKPSNVTDRDRLYYDTGAPYQKKIAFLQHYKPEVMVKKPNAYVIPQGYERVVARLKMNGIEMKTLERDTILEGEISYITDLKSGEQAYEGHFYHTEVTTRRQTQKVPCYAGDKIAYTGQAGDAYLVHVLEPEAHDSFFRWGFFDGILMQKEYFSPYLFENTAEDLLADNPTLKAAFETKKAEDEAFAKNGWAQLMYIYRRSPYYEKTHMRYPVVRL